MKSKSMIFEIIKKELIDVIRDKKTIIMMILVPMLLLPIMISFLAIMEDSMMNVEESAYNTIGFAFEPDSTLNTVIEELGIQKQIGTKEELEEKFNNLEINAYITLEDKEFTIYYTEEDMYGQYTLQLAYELIEGYKQIEQSYMLTREGLVPDEIFNVYTVKAEELSDKNAITEMLLGMIPTFILMITTLTAVMASIDMTAGEKERGTLETLLTFPLKSKDIIYGKFLATTICTVVSAILGFVSLYTVTYFLSKSLETFKGMEMLTLQNIILVLIIFIVYAMLISAISIVVASKAKSFKEAQNSTQPLTFLSIIPMFVSSMGVQLDTTLALIPFINVNLILSDIIANSVNMHFFTLAIFSNLIFTTIVLKLIIKLYKSDKILFS